MRVLFVEDSEVNRRVIREMLRAGGLEMSEAEDGAMGVEMVEANDYDPVSYTHLTLPTNREV